MEYGVYGFIFNPNILKTLKNQNYYAYKVRQYHKILKLGEFSDISVPWVGKRWLLRQSLPAVG